MRILQGIDLAGKTGSAQTISNALKAKLGAGGKKFKDNGWFVGVEPRRDPEIVVCTLLEEGRARLSRRQDHRASDQGLRGETAPAAHQDGGLGQWQDNDKVEIGAVWSDSGGANEDGPNKNEDHLRAGRFFLDVSRKRAPLAVAAPGLH